MTVQSIMSFQIEKLRPTDKVCEALRTMHQHRVHNLPVVDDDDQFIGVFGIRQLIRALLPRAAQVESGLTDLSFMPDELGELYKRLEKVGQRTVVEFLEKKEDLLVCEPHTPFPEALELLDQSFSSSLPVIVVDGKTKKTLVGMVSAWDVLEKLVANVFPFDEEETGATQPADGQ